MIRWRGFTRLESYMQFPVPQITSIVLLAHMVLGCCWHHTHTCAMTRCDRPLGGVAASGCGIHAHDEIAPKHEQHAYTPVSRIDVSHSDVSHIDVGVTHNDDTPHPHRCGGDRCSFVRTESWPAQTGEFCFDLCPVDAALFSAKPAWIRAHQTYSQGNWRCNDGPPVRAHLLFSVLLI